MKSKLILSFYFYFYFGFAQISEQKLDELIKIRLKPFDVPEMSVGVIKDGKVIYSKGFGVVLLLLNYQ